MGRSKQVSDEALLDAAREVFVEKGFGASTREIAGRAGISEAVLYQRHGTKIDLFFAAMIPPAVELPAGGGGKDLAGDLEELAEGMARYFRSAMPLLMQLVTHPSFRLADLEDRESSMPIHGLGEAVQACLERHRGKGAITADARRTRAAALALVATMHSIALFEIMGAHGGVFPRQAVRDVASLIAAGLSARKGGVR